MSRLAPSFIKRMGEPAVWRSRQLGARSAVTGFPVVTWLSGICFDCTCFDPDCFLCDYNIEVLKEIISTREIDVGGTRMTQKVIKFFTWAPIEKDDELDYHGETYVVESVGYDLYLTGAKSYQHCVMVEKSRYGDMA